MSLSFFKPAAPKYILFAVAGLLWGLVGVMLCWKGYQRVETIPSTYMILIELWGWAMAAGAYKLIFSKIAEKNIRRLEKLPPKQCFFAFQPWKSYFIILIMVFLGLTLRRIPLPGYVMAVMYTTIGGALFLSSFLYYRHLLRSLSGNKSNP